MSRAPATRDPITFDSGAKLAGVDASTAHHLPTPEPPADYADAEQHRGDDDKGDERVCDDKAKLHATVSRAETSSFQRTWLAR